MENEPGSKGRPTHDFMCSCSFVVRVVKGFQELLVSRDSANILRRRTIFTTQAQWMNSCGDGSHHVSKLQHMLPVVAEVVRIGWPNFLE